MLLSLVLLVLAGVSRVRVKLYAGLFGATVVQMLLAWAGDASKWLGGLHPVNALVVLGLAATLAHRAFRSAEAGAPETVVSPAA